MKRETTLAGLDPRLVNWLTEIRAEWSAIQPDIEIRILETIRSAERQAWLYAQGRTRPGLIVTWVTHSNHQDGLAIDIGLFCGDEFINGDTPMELALYRALAAMAERRDVTCLGRRVGKDWFHYEVPPT